MLRRTIDFVLEKHFFIAFAALSQAVIGFHILGKPFQPVYGLFIFCATIIAYNTGILKRLLNESREASEKGIRVILWISTLLCTFSLFYFPIDVFPYIALAGLIAVGYSESILPFGLQKPLRRIKGSKAFIVSIGWIISCYVVPAELSATSILTSGPLLFCAARFCLIAALCLEFDIRDRDGDFAQNVRSLPVLIGIERTRMLNYALLLTAFCLNLFNSPFLSLPQQLCLELFLCLTGSLFYFKKKLSPKYYYLLYLDGILLLQVLVIFLK